MGYRVWRVGLASKYYEGRDSMSQPKHDSEILDICKKEGIFPFHVNGGLIPSNYPDPQSFANQINPKDYLYNESEDGAEDKEKKSQSVGVWISDSWKIYNFIMPGDRVIISKVRKKSETYIYAKGTVTRSPYYLPGKDPFGYRIDVKWDTFYDYDTPKLARSLKGANVFYKELTDYDDWENQLRDCDELELYQKSMKKITNHSLNTILCGPPGTGKTWNTRKIALEICKGEVPKVSEIAAQFEELIAPNEALVEFVTFHPSYDYTDFIEGFKPNKEGSFTVVPGVLKRMATRATQNPSKNYLIIIDEINRGNISKIFGEAITLLEEDKRSGAKNGFPISLKLPTSPNEKFILPKNLYVLGTMNTADRSIAMLDIALRRRFDFKEVMPDPTLLEDAKDPSTLKTLSQEKLLTNLNNWISRKLNSRDHQVGHAWLDMGDAPTIDSVAAKFEHKIIPLLLEWFYDQTQRDELFRDLFKIEKFADYLNQQSKKDKLSDKVKECMFNIAERKSSNEEDGTSAV
jgi:nucleoside-triphosphatase THEP1